jgi:FKBP-type peptidyl-prolyl cis-trans isomerase 2
MAAVIIVVVLIVSSVGVFLFATGSGAGEKTVAKGSVIKVNYYGQYWNGERMVVFDTSLFSVADDNTTYPKSMFFSYAGNATRYSTLNFTVGSGQMIAGFDEGVVGMKIGQTKVLTIPMEKAYRAMDPAKLKTIHLNDTKTVTQTMTKAEFKAYFGEDPMSFKPYKDPIYGWGVDVQFDGTDAYITNRIPSGGADFKVYASSTDASYGWYANVTVVDSVIYIHHLLDADSGLHVKGMDSLRNRMFVESVDMVNGTAVLNWNRDVAGRTLTFTVTLVAIQ